MKYLLILSVSVLLCAKATADSIRKIDLQHRDAEATQALLLDLFEDDITMVVDGNSLLVRGASADLKALADMLARLDQPQPNVRVSLYRGVDPYRGDIDESQRRTATTQLHRDNVQDQWIIESGTTLTLRDNQRVLDTLEQRLIEQDSQGTQSLLTTQASSSRLETNQHKIKLTLAEDQKTARLVLKTQLANRGAGLTNGELSTEVETRRMIPTKQWVRLFYRQNQASQLTLEQNTHSSTVLNFDDEQVLWVRVDPLN